MIENNYITIQGFMIETLKLKGNELILFALIFGFCQNGEQHKISLSFIQKWLSCSKPTAIETIKSLINKNLISKEQINKKGIIYNAYLLKRSNKDIYYNLPDNRSKNFTGKKTLHSQKILPSTGKEILPSTGKEILPNNNKDNINRNNYIDANAQNNFFETEKEENFDLIEYLGNIFK